MTASTAFYLRSCGRGAAVALSCAALCSLAAAADDESPKPLPQSGLFSSLKQAVKQGYDQEVIHGYFVQGTPPNQRRYYCVVDVKTGREQGNAVVGEPMPLPSGMTGIKVSAVSLYLCADAEREGLLVTEGFTLTGPAARAATGAAAPASGGPAAAPVPTPAASAPAAASRAPAAGVPIPAPPPASLSPGTSAAAAPAAVAPSPAATPASPVAVSSAGSPDRIDVAGVRLGMSPDQVRAVLRSKMLHEYRESAESLSGGSSAAPTAVPNGRFVNVIATWSPEAEAYEVMFTPVPGRERVMGIIHSVGYPPAVAPREAALEAGLVRKYGGHAASAPLPQSPTWRLQSSGTMETGDACARRGTLGGLSALAAGSPRENLALKLGTEELRAQAEHCGVAIVTEDQLTGNGGALREDRTVTRFTVTAYSPALALEGARAAEQLVHAGGAGRNGPLPVKAQPTPEL